MCHDAFPEMYPADGSNLVNLDRIDHLEKTAYSMSVVFRDSQHKANVARLKARQLGKVFPVKKV
ncbi:hypothetical protein D3C74_432300 [compost metagenome]